MLAKLSEQNEKLCQRFAKNCAEIGLSNDLFPLKEADGLRTWSQEKYKVQFAHTGRLKESAAPFLHRLLIECKILIFSG